MKNLTKITNKSILLKKLGMKSSDKALANNDALDPAFQELEHKKKHFVYMTAGGVSSTVISALSLKYLNNVLPIDELMILSESDRLNFTLTATKVSIALNTFSVKLGFNYFSHRNALLSQQIVKEESQDSQSQER